MIAAFILILGLNGEVLSAGRSRHTFDTIEACQAYQPGALAIVAADMASRGTEFGKMETLCLPDIGQTPADVFGLKQPMYEAPTPDPTILPPQ